MQKHDGICWHYCNAVPSQPCHPEWWAWQAVQKTGKTEGVGDARGRESEAAGAATGNHLQLHHSIFCIVPVTHNCGTVKVV